MNDKLKLDSKALLERLQALEAENAKLKDSSVQSQAQLVVVETEYKGHPMLEFRRANARPFSMGLKKLEAVHKCWDAVETFLEKYSDNMSANTDDQI